jgi:hypothetical protein
LKRVLIISPHFPPVNAADMQRVRQMLPYLKQFGWEAEVITVDQAFIESYSIDELLCLTVPLDVKVHYIKAWRAKLTRKLGLGSLSMRSFFHFRNAGNRLLKQKKFDLIFFSTTAFHVMALGPYWKRKFKIPFVLDIQDPWRNDFYVDKPKKERPPKFFISYNIEKFLERLTVPKADGIISVSSGYIDVFTKRYTAFNHSKSVVIPFGAMTEDFTIANEKQVQGVALDGGKCNIVYIGRGGHDMRFAVKSFFVALQKGLNNSEDLFKNIHCWFIGTSYAKAGAGIKTILPIAAELGLATYVTEITDRLPYFETLSTLAKADLLFVPGSTDTNYTASKIYPYVLAKRPILGIFHETSSVVSFLNDVKAGNCITFKTEGDKITGEIYNALCNILKSPATFETDWNAFHEYSAMKQTEKQVRFFDDVLNGFSV